MIVWLASYPRSGNTLTRTLLHQVFGLLSHSQHNDPIIGSAQQVSAIVGHLPFNGEWAETRCRLQADTGLHVVKTHAPPTEDASAIYVVRDGRAALVSHRLYLQRLHGQAYSLRQLSDATHPMLDWSGHLDRWNPLRRPGTLVLRYEDILDAPGRIIALLASFLGRSPMRAWVNPFDTLNCLMPDFFRRASNAANIAEWQQEDLAAFQARHGSWMRALGYDDAAPASFMSGITPAFTERQA